MKNVYHHSTGFNNRRDFTHTDVYKTKFIFLCEEENITEKQ